MQSFFLRAVAVASVFSAVVSQSIDPNSVTLSLRTSWCSSQIAQCPLICTQENDGSAATIANDCDARTLGYDCVCGNGLTPNASEYSQTIPYYICTQANSNCQANCGISNNACAAACVQNNPCGAKNPTRVNSSTITTMSSTSTAMGGAKSTAADGSVVYTGFGGSAATTTAASSHKSGSAALRLTGMGEIYGLGVVAAGIFAGFTLLL